MTELEQLEKKVADTKDAYDDAGAYLAASYADYIAAYDAWSRARIELSDYLKEHGDEHSI